MQKVNIINFRQSLAKLQKKLESKESAISALTEQLAYLKVQNQETNKLREENENLKKKIQTLTGYVYFIFNKKKK